MQRFSQSCLLLLLLLATACQSSSYAADFAANEVFYVDVPFRTKAPGDRTVFVAPVVDGRDPSTLPNQERGFPIAYGADDFWERPVAEMFGEVLTRQLAGSELFGAVVARATPESLVCKPTLLKFVNGAAEAISGSSSFAEVAVRLVVLGPAGPDGQRAVVHDQIYANRQVSPTEVNPVNPYRLIGRALQVSMLKVLAGLDGSNVARSQVPVAAEAATEVAAVPATTATPGR